uniref:G-protein coupled receptors family 1 profile domain-containing protein n=1 Tax=Romanomermis culicivorax TaxID=13658 RepID=A0A915KMU0_ROMCU
MAILDKAVILIACFELAELFAFCVDNFPQEPIPFCCVTKAMGVHTQLYGTLVSTALSIVSPIIYCVCFAYLLFQRYLKRDLADLVAVKRRIKNAVTWALAFMASWQVMTVVVACAYSLSMTYNSCQASNRFTGCLVLMNGIMFFVGNTIYLKNFRSAAMMVLCCKSSNSVGNVASVVALNAWTANNTPGLEMN